GVLVGEADLDGEIAGVRLGLLGEEDDLAFGPGPGARELLVQAADLRLLSQLELLGDSCRNEAEHVDLFANINDICDQRADRERLPRHHLDTAESAVDRRGKRVEA